MKDNISGGIPNVLGVRYVEVKDNNKMTYIDVNSLNRCAMSQPVPFGELLELSSLDENEEEQMLEKNSTTS